MSKANGLPVAWLKEKGIKVAEGDMLGSDRYEEKPMTKEALRIVNDTSDHDDAYVTSFAARPNTGKQPVDDDVEVDIWYDDEMHLNQPPSAWDWDDEDIENWTINHAALLAKFKEQGANTVRQYDDQEAELATHYSGNNNRFYIKGHTMIRKAMVLNDDGRWIYSDCTTNAELDGDEFWKLDGKQVLSEGWVIDQLTDKPTREQQLSKASEALREDYDKGMRKCVRDIARLVGHSFGSDIGYDNLANVVDRAINGILDKPVFTQEMAKHHQAAPIGSSVQTSMGEGVVVAHGVSYGRSQVVIQTNETMLSLDDSQYYPIDNRTDKDKVVDALRELLESLNIDSAEVSEALTDLMSDKFTITLNKD